MSETNDTRANCIERLALLLADRSRRLPTEWDDELDYWRAVVEPAADELAAQKEYAREQFKLLIADADHARAQSREVWPIAHQYRGRWVEAREGRDRLQRAVTALREELAKVQAERDRWRELFEMWERAAGAERESRFRWAEEAAQLEADRDLLAWLHAEATQRLYWLLPHLSYWRDITAPALSSMLRRMAGRLTHMRRCAISRDKDFRQANARLIRADLPPVIGPPNPELDEALGLPESWRTAQDVPILPPDWQRQLAACESSGAGVDLVRAWLTGETADPVPGNERGHDVGADKLPCAEWQGLGDEPWCPRCGWKSELHPEAEDDR